MKHESEKDRRRLYNDLAWTWPIISPPEDYIEETELMSRTIREYSQTDVKTLLSIGCGGGHNDYSFKKHFTVTGVDISNTMLGLAGKLNPDAEYYQGDMRTVRLDKTFDAVVILDSINYMTTNKDLRRAFITAYEHLTPGGVFLTLVEKIAYQGKGNDCQCSTHSSGDVDIAFIENYYDPDPGDTNYEATFIYLIRRNGVLEIETDHHLCGIFKLETWVDLLRDAGFEVHQEKFTHSTLAPGESFPMLIGIRPQT